MCSPCRVRTVLSAESPARLFLRILPFGQYTSLSGNGDLIISSSRPEIPFFVLVREAVESWESRGGWGKGMMDRQYEGGLDGAVGLDCTVPVWYVWMIVVEWLYDRISPAVR